MICTAGFDLTNCSRHCKKELSQRRKERKGKDNEEIGKAVVGAAIFVFGDKALHPKNSLASLAILARGNLELDVSPLGKLAFAPDRLLIPVIRWTPA